MWCLSSLFGSLKRLTMMKDEVWCMYCNHKTLRNMLWPSSSDSSVLFVQHASRLCWKHSLRLISIFRSSDILTTCQPRNTHQSCAFISWTRVHKNFHSVSLLFPRWISTRYTLLPFGSNIFSVVWLWLIMIDVGSQRLHRPIGEDIEVVDIAEYILQRSLYEKTYLWSVALWTQNRSYDIYRFSSCSVSM
jgi:hypothetical protein